MDVCFFFDITKHLEEKSCVFHFFVLPLQRKLDAAQIRCSENGCKGDDK